MKNIFDYLIIKNQLYDIIYYISSEMCSTINNGKSKVDLEISLILQYNLLNTCLL